jgi:crossover junction endodeoxyribonuclease RusA
MTTQGKKWKEEVGWMAATERGKQKWIFSSKEKIVMELSIFWPDKRRRDADNIIKIIQDSLSGVLYEDDKWVLPRVMNWQVDKEDPRVEVKLWRLGEI